MWLNSAMKPGAPLTGNFNLKSDLIIADDFMAFADGPPAAAGKPAANAPASTGVIMVPQNLNLTFTN